MRHGANWTVVKRLVSSRRQGHPENLSVLTTFAGARNISYALCISIAERREWRRKRGGREGDIHKTRRTNSGFVMIARLRIALMRHEISQHDEYFIYEAVINTDFLPCLYEVSW